MIVSLGIGDKRMGRIYVIAKHLFMIKQILINDARMFLLRDFYFCLTNQNVLETFACLF